MPGQSDMRTNKTHLTENRIGRKPGSTADSSQNQGFPHRVGPDFFFFRILPAPDLPWQVRLGRGGDLLHSDDRPVSHLFHVPEKGMVVPFFPAVAVSIGI